MAGHLMRVFDVTARACGQPDPGFDPFLLSQETIDQAVGPGKILESFEAVIAEVQRLFRAKDDEPLMQYLKALRDRIRERAERA